MATSYFGDKKVLEVILAGKTMYKFLDEVSPPPTGGLEVISGIGFVSGYIGLNDTSESLAQSGNTKTTEWVTIRPSMLYKTSFSSGNRFVIQVKNSAGQITYLGDQSNGSDTVADGGIFFTKSDSVSVRIYFTTTAPTPPVVISFTSTETTEVNNYYSGYIANGSTSESLPQSGNTQTTEWVSVDSNSTYHMTYSQSNRCVIQLKESSGVIAYSDAYSKQYTADGEVFTTRANTSFARVYFLNEVPNENIYIKFFKEPSA